MRVINSKSAEVVALTHSKRRVDGVTIHDKFLFFSKCFCVCFGIKSGQYAHFINEGSEWRFIVNDDSEGFIFANDSKQNGALYIFNSGLCQLIRKTTGIEGNVFCQIKNTVQEYKEKPVFFISTGRPTKIIPPIKKPPERVV